MYFCPQRKLFTGADSLQIQDIKALLGDKSDEEQKEIPQNSLVDLLSLGRAGAGSNLERLLPHTQEQRDTLLDVFFER